jgi:hypothetical protein
MKHAEGDEKCVRSLVGKPQGKGSCECPRHRREAVRINFRKLGMTLTGS